MNIVNDERDKKVCTVLKDLLDTTTLHGLPKISTSKHIAVRLFWCCVFIAAFVLFVLQMNGLIMEYRSNPKQTTISLESGTVKFPAITICNTNAVKLSKVTIHDQMTELANAKAVPRFGEGVILRFRPWEADVYDYIRKGYTITDESHMTYFPRETYWEMVDAVREMYYQNNKRPSEIGVDPRLLSWEELLALAGRRIQTPVPTATTLTVTKPTSPSPPITATTTTAAKATTTIASPPTTTTSSATTNSLLLTTNTTATASSRLTTTTTITTQASATTTNQPTTTTSKPSTSTRSRRKQADHRDMVLNLRKARDGSFPFFNIFKGILDEPKYQQPMALWTERSAIFGAILRQQSSNVRYHIGHQFEDFVISSFFGQEKGGLEYKRSWTKDYGTCFTIDSPKYQTRQSGPSNECKTLCTPRNGFDLLLNLEMDEYITNIQESHGVRIVLHEQGTVPFPNTEGITLAPGYEHQIGLKIVETSRLGYPYGSCTDGKQFRETYNINYTRATCTEVCWIEESIKECGCMPETASEILEEYVDLPVCKYSMNVSVVECTERLHSKFDADSNPCQCTDPCRTTEYLKTISGRPWPAHEYLTSVIIDSWCDYDGEIMPSMLKMCRAYWETSVEFDVQRYRNNFMKLKIYFEDTQYQMIEEEPTYGTVRFLSDIGGTAGLFIGASVLSLAEIVHVAFEVILYLRNRRKLNPKNSEREGKDVER